MIRLGVIINPTSGRGKGKALGEELLRLLAATAFEVVNLSGLDLDGARENGRRAIAGGAIDGLVVLGGDGMMNLGVNLCVDTNVPLLVIGAGTGNDSARELGMPIYDVAASVAHLEKFASRPTAVDVVRVENPDGVFHYFGSVSAGFDAIVNARANRWVWPKGSIRYPLAMLRELPVFKPIQYRVTVDGKVRELDAMLIAVANAPAYGGGMKIAPHADCRDGLLELFIVHKMKRLELIRMFPTVYTGGHVTHPAVEFIQGREVTLEAQGLPAFADGERVGRAPLTAKVLPGALKVYA